MKKCLAFIIACALVVSCASCGAKKQDETAKGPVTYESAMDSLKDKAKGKEVICWYTDDTDKEWIEAAAKNFNKKYGVNVKPVAYDGVQLFEDINSANQKENGPDMYICGNDLLEFAKTAGVLSENDILDDEFWDKNYPKTSVNALTYKGKRYGYPVYFDTYCLVYDANLLENAPASIDDILTFLDEYEDTGSTKAVFRWDVADPYINTMFLASYANLFGENGDDLTSFTVNGEKEIEAMKYFQSLSEYLWMDKNNISHDTIINRIKDGTLVIGMCKSDILPVLYEMKSNAATTEEAGTEENDETENTEESTKEATNYTVSYVPSLTSELSSTCLSTTYGAFINPYGKETDAANMFALYLSVENQANQFAGNGKLPVVNQKDGFDDMQTVLYAQYQNSKPVPKVMLTGNYMLESAMTFDNIWKGADAEEELNKLQQSMQEMIGK
ncbi:MAG: extracellular solute-binding protein [Lachnospiraceae bacterium]|jgi:arabinogalactan oligomer/maltooligosaccharide transport system substrate-binding protein|nr:extracellular solute-binding protein [Lachnospiraceae bacterium]